MSRPLRIEFSGAFYHVTSHGNARADIVDAVRQIFVDALAATVERFGWIRHRARFAGPPDVLSKVRRERSSMAEQKLPKLTTGVRSPSPAPSHRQQAKSIDGAGIWSGPRYSP